MESKRGALRARAKPTFVVGLDTEDDGAGEPFLWAFTHAEGAARFTTRNEALTYLDKLGSVNKERGRVVELWATNLEYDLCNLFDRDRIAEVWLRFGRHALTGAQWHGVRMRDTLRHLPASVAELGELVGLKKLEGDLFTRGRPTRARDFERYARRCQRDATITFRAAAALYRMTKPLGQLPRMTLASTALRLWQERFWKRPVVRPSSEVWSAALEAYHGGRTQAFAVGTFDAVRVVDVASMFPWAMIDAPLPLPWGLVHRWEKGEPLVGHALYHVEVTSELRRPRLPVRTDAGTVFPNGKWRGWYVGEELLAFERAGGRVRVLAGLVFLETCRPFEGYVRAMFARKNRARGLKRLFYKLLLNSLYGKFGQQGRVVRAMPLARFEKLARAPLSWREWNGLVIWSEEGMPPPWSNNVWPAFVTARARVRLADEIDRLEGKGARALYVDTDSIMYQGKARYAPRAKRIGDFEARGQFARALIVGKKEYALETADGSWLAHAKGVPAAERMRYLHEGNAEFDRPTRMREAARVGGQANVWRRVRKVRRTVQKGSPGAAGETPTPRIGRGSELKPRKKD